MCLVPQFITAPGRRARKCDICNEILHTIGVREGLQKAKEYANKVKQCCEVCKKPVCRKHSHIASGIT